MDYAERIESHTDDAATLDRIREEIRADASLDDDDRDRLSERIGMYLADAGRQVEPFDEDTVPDEEDDAGA